ncbi:MAG: phycobilisome Linker polypeptide [Symploca sp. SIO2E9]|nr:phycobilisome Linker polypeptide [Symploca sp. SIO2E9]
MGTYAGAGGPSEKDLAFQRQYQALQYQYQAFEDKEPLELLLGRSEEEIENIIRAVYRQVLGNAHIMESERLAVPESQIRLGEISVREFVRQVAKSQLYRSRFFDNCPRYRSIELNFKHLLGRAPDDYSEMKYHSSILDTKGYEADIDSYIDSDEYQDAFGENIVPFYRGYKTQTGKKLLGFTNMFQLLPSVSSSDKDLVSGNYPRLSKPIIYNNPSGIAPVTDIDKLLTEVLKPKIKLQSAEGPTQEELAQQKAYQDLQAKFQEQIQLLETLSKQLDELRPLATIGTSQLNKWQSYSSSPGAAADLITSRQFPSQMAESSQPLGTYEALQQQYAQQEKEIADLREKIADLQRSAVIGEARLNKWRSRTFSG